MKVTRANNTTKELAKDKLKVILPQLVAEFGAEVSNPTHQWTADVMAFSFRVRGFEVSGELAVTDNDVVVDVAIPFFARLMEGNLRTAAEQKLQAYFPG